MNRGQLIEQRLAQTTAQLAKTTPPASLVAISKYSNVIDIEHARRAGQRHFGENRIQELQQKASYFEEQDIVWHFVGQLQSNKINNLLRIPNLGFIHSVGILKHLRLLYEKQHRFKGKKLGIFLQINSSGEKHKGGFVQWEELLRALQECRHLQPKYPKVQLCGLMTMAPSDGDAAASFKKLRDYRQQIIAEGHWPPPLQLSMGMSRDYKIALQYGSNFVRLGHAIFAIDKA